MRRRTFMLAMGGAAAGAMGHQAHAADAGQQVFDLFAKIASALSDGDPGIFIDAIDPGMPGVEDFRRRIVALTDLADLTNSIEIYSDTGDDTHRTDDLDWFLEIVGKSEPHPLERRRKVVKFHLERKGKKWKIMSIDPMNFFAPPKIT